MGTYCYVASAGAVGSAARGASAPTEREEWRGHIVAAARLQLVKSWAHSNNRAHLRTLENPSISFAI